MLSFPPVPLTDFDAACKPANSTRSIDALCANVLIGKLKRQRAALLDKDAHHAKFERVARHLESADGCFVCGHCLQFSTWSPDQLVRHVGDVHQQLAGAAADTVCPYCFAEVPLVEAAAHQAGHFASAAGGEASGGAAVPPDDLHLYPCPRCHLRLEDRAALVVHWRGECGRGGGSGDLPCRACGRQFATLGLLASHLEESVRPLYHCGVPGCLVKSPGRLAVQRHLARRHPGQAATAVATTDYLACASRHQLVAMETATSVTMTTASAANSKQHAKLDRSSLVLCLKCPHCGTATVSWARFVHHQTVCLGGLQAAAAGDGGASVYSYELSHCSQCGAVSTEAGLIDEHMECAHPEGGAVRLHEEVTTRDAAIDSWAEQEQQEQQQHQRLETSVLARTLLAAAAAPGALKRPAAADFAADLSLASAAASAKISRLLGNGAVGGAEGSSSNSVSCLTSDDQLVTIPFDEAAFRAAFPVGCPEAESVVEKLRRLPQYRARVLRREHRKQVPECPACKREFAHGLSDYRRHLMTVHLDVPVEYIVECLRATRMPGEEGTGDGPSEEQSAPLEKDLRRVQLPFSDAVLRRLTRHFSRETQNHLAAQMRTYTTMHVLVDSRSSRKYQCGLCSYASPHSLADVRKHVLGAHCGISTRNFRYCLQASRLDPVEFTLPTDAKLLRLAQDSMVGRCAEAGDAAASPPPEQVRLVTPPATEHQQQHQQQRQHQRQHPLARLESAVLLANPAPQSPKSTPLTSDSVNNNNNNSISSGNNNGNGNGSLHFGQNASHFEEADNVDEEEVISLPFSEPVLRHLLVELGQPARQQDLLMEKMRAYSGYQLVRQMVKGKTVAYKCQCGRIFHTVRRPGTSVRPSTLADARRHVMGVHARVSHEMLTTCCQASRISRENNWSLFTEDMLLKLASERPTKTTTTTTPNATSVTAAQRSSEDTANFEEEEEDNAASSNCSATVDTEQHQHQHQQQHQQEQLANIADPLLAAAAFASLLYSSQPVWPSMLPTPTPLLDGAGAASTTATAMATAMAAVNGSRAEPPPIQPHEVATEEQRMATLNGLPDGELERVIELPYSYAALQSLTEGGCDQDTMEILRTKMDYYSLYRVAVTRQDGRRLFRCSSCSASSPHGMGDIRKHILGVHAKVPDRFKTACLHASRLSRDDNRLLPDALLVQLARLKWKGTAAATTTAAAAAAHAGKSRYDDDEEASSSSSSAPAAAVRLKIRPPPATAAEVNDNVPDYADGENEEEEEEAVPAEMEPTVDRPQVPAEFFIVREADGGGSRSGALVASYRCSLCQVGASAAGPVRGHIVRDHMGVPGHKCSICGRLYALRRHVFRHHMLEHPRREFHLLQYSPYRYAMNRVGVKGRGSGSPSNGLGTAEEE